jgi:hypothetical protein
MTITHSVRPTGYALLLLCSVGWAAPALADHPAGGNGALTGGGMQVSGPDTLEAGGLAGGLRFTYLRPDNRSDETLIALAGQHIHAHTSDYTLRTSVGLAYGLTDRLMFAFDLPYLRHDDIREGEHSHVGGVTHNSVAERGSVAGVGDATLLAKYRLIGDADQGLALLAGLKLPTGSTHKRDAEGERFETEHQPGSGSWDPIVGIAVGTPVGAMQLNGSVVYQKAGKGAMHTRLGDRAQGGISLAHRFGPPDHHDDSDDAPHGHESWDAFVELTGEWEGRQTEAGVVEEESGGRAVYFSPGARYNSASGWSVAAAVGVPVWQRIRASHPDNGYRLTLALGRAF